MEHPFRPPRESCSLPVGAEKNPLPRMLSSNSNHFPVFTPGAAAVVVVLTFLIVLLKLFQLFSNLKRCMAVPQGV